MRKVALITGGTRGIGLGIAEALASEGTDLILCGRRPQSDVQPTLDELGRFGQAVHYIAADLGQSEERKLLMNEARRRCDHLNILVNNAGMAPRERNHILDASEKSFTEVMRVNLQGPYFLTQQCARWMIESKQTDSSHEGCIININSISATVASVNRGEYCVSKAGLSMVTQLWAVALGEHGIPVYEIRPGITMTDMTSGVKEKYDAMIADGLLIEPRWGTPEDIGKTAAMLARGDLPYATGQVLTLDGGLTLSRL